MKKIAYLIGAALMIAGMFASCSLDSMSLTEKDTTNFPKTAEDANQALAAIYQNLNNVNAFPQQSFLYNSLLACDDMLGGGGPNDKLMQSLDLICNTGTNATQDYWVARYQGINRANTLLEALAGIEMDPEVRAQAEGEAKFLRAFYYYELASMYGRVPLVLLLCCPKILLLRLPLLSGGRFCRIFAMRLQICRLFASRMGMLINIRLKLC